MSRIAAKFAELKKRKEAALIPFVTAGDPDLATTAEVLRALEAGGADCIELGIPFSDPTADGPTIQRSSELPIILFGYFNPIFRYGVKKFCREACRAGADGVLCVDLPPEESAELKRWTDAEGLDIIYLLSPTSDPNRLRLVARQNGRGFVYYVSVTGVTGARRSLDERLRSQVARVRRAPFPPVPVGVWPFTPK